MGFGFPDSYTDFLAGNFLLWSPPMGHSLMHFAFQAGYAWIFCNLAVFGFLAVVFSVEQLRLALRGRRTAAVRRLAPVICIARR